MPKPTRSENHYFISYEPFCFTQNICCKVHPAGFFLRMQSQNLSELLRRCRRTGQSKSGRQMHKSVFLQPLFSHFLPRRPLLEGKIYSFLLTRGPSEVPPKPETQRQQLKGSRGACGQKTPCTPATFSCWSNPRQFPGPHSPTSQQQTGWA